MKTNQATLDAVTAIQENAQKLRNIQRPYKYSLFPLFPDLLPPHEWVFTSPPQEHDLCGYRMNAEGTIGTYTQLYECYEDKRYLAKLRLFYYLHPERKPTGKSIYEGTEIGKSLPILNY